MSKQNFAPNQLVYTKGYSSLPDGTQLVVAESHKGDTIVSCLNGLKQYHFINESMLSITKVAHRASVPAWLSSLTKTQVTPGRMVYVYGFSELVDNAIVYVSETFIATDSTDIRCVMKSKSPWEYYEIPLVNLYTNTYSHNRVQTVTVKKPLASEFTEFTDDHKYMIELLKEPKRANVIEMTLRGVDLGLYEAVVGLKYFILYPKESTDKFMPMIMAHTDIQRNVSHPNENLEYDPKLDKFSSPKGLGADDRAGCYAINKILLNHPGKFIVALFDEEEIGCIGSGDFIKDKQFKEIDKKVSCYISIDRRRGYNGVSQIATYGYNNTKLFDLVKTATGRATVNGSSTDCLTLSKGSKALPKNKGVACFNVSCGYEGEHTASESLYFKELQKVVTDFDQLVLSAEGLWKERFEAIPVKAAPKTYYGSSYGNSIWPADDEIEVDGEYYDSADVKTLLYYFNSTSGIHYTFAKAAALCKEFEVDNYVRFDTACVPEGTYGGMKLSKDLHTALSGFTWIVTQTRGMLCDLQSECLTKTASNIPFAWLQLITVSDALVETN